MDCVAQMRKMEDEQKMSYFHIISKCDYQKNLWDPA